VSRVVAGQRIMQAASDIFLGWFRSAHRHDYYLRQFSDMKVSIGIQPFRPRTTPGCNTREPAQTRRNVAMKPFRQIEARVGRESPIHRDQSVETLNRSASSQRNLKCERCI